MNGIDKSFSLYGERAEETEKMVVRGDSEKFSLYGRDENNVIVMNIRKYEPSEMFVQGIDKSLYGERAEKTEEMVVRVLESFGRKEAGKWII